jgi:hypothetical protein
VARRVGDGHPSCTRDGLDRPLTLGQQVNDLDALWAAERRTHAGEQFEDSVFELTSFHKTSIQVYD